jgi:hypothetical protein
MADVCNLLPYHVVKVKDYRVLLTTLARVRQQVSD